MVKRWLAILAFGCGLNALADEYTDAWGPPAGTEIAAFELSDQAGNTRTTAELMGAKGLLLFYNRSADW